MRNKHISEMTEEEIIESKIHHTVNVAKGLNIGLGKLNERRLALKLKSENEKLEHKNLVVKLIGKI
jgi:hypothetical protein